MDLSAQVLPQSWYNGQGLKPLVETVSGLWKGLVTTGQKLWENWSNWIQKQLKKINIFGVNLGSWFDDDPVGATAGTGAFLLGGGVIVAVAGATKGIVVGGVKLLWRAAKQLISRIATGKLIRWAVGGVQRIWNFNWQISDKQIRQQQASQLNGLAGTWGEALGSVVGTLCGFSLGRIAISNQRRNVKINPELIAKLEELKLNTFSEESELWEESVENLKAAVSASMRTGLNIAMMEGFLNARKIIKSASRGLNLKAIAPGLANMVDKWGEEGQEPWSFAIAQEKFVESLPEGAIQNFTEDFLEAAQDMCAESTILVSYAMG